MRPIVLASQSPRRKALFRQLGLPFKIMRPTDDELMPEKTARPGPLVQKNALCKASSVMPRVKEGIIIGVDTIVYQKGRVFGKPSSLPEARNMLKILSQAPHWVYTGIAILDRDAGTECSWAEKTKVFMRPLRACDIDRYLALSDPYDKAGGYAIQERGDLLVRRIEGDFFNVVGLPLVQLDIALQKLLNKEGQ